MSNPTLKYLTKPEGIIIEELEGIIFSQRNQYFTDQAYDCGRKNITLINIKKCE